jgi:hypothetical protein
MLPGNMHVEFLDHCFLFRNSIYVFPAYASRAFSNQCIEEEQSIKLPGAGVRYVSLRRRQRPVQKKLFAWHGLNVRLACCVGAQPALGASRFSNFAIWTYETGYSYMITHTVPNARATGAPGRGRTLPLTCGNRPGSIACRHATGPWAIGAYQLTIAIPTCARGTGHSGQPTSMITIARGQQTSMEVRSFGGQKDGTNVSAGRH